MTRAPPRGRRVVDDRMVSVYFYGGLINPKVQQSVGLTLAAPVTAILHGYTLVFEPWVNLRCDPGGHVYGLLAAVPHAMLAQVYERLAARYDPYPVTCVVDDGQLRPALCYIAPTMSSGPIDRTHVENLAEGAAECGFPDAYVTMIRSFCG